MGKKPKTEAEEIEFCSKKRIEMYEKRFKEDLETAEECFCKERDIRYYLWGKGFEFALYILNKEIDEGL